MSTVHADMSMSLDGYIDAAGATPEEGLGRGGEVLHEWLNDPDGSRVLEYAQAVGAIVCGRRTYDRSLRWWGPDGPSGAERVPVLVLTHAPPDEAPEGSVYQFVQGEAEDVLASAREAAGNRDVAVMGAHAVQQFIAAGLVDEIHLHLVPVLFGAGTRLFELDLPSHIRLEQHRVDVSPSATHLVYRVSH